MVRKKTKHCEDFSDLSEKGGKMLYALWASDAWTSSSWTMLCSLVWMGKCTSMGGLEHRSRKEDTWKFGSSSCVFSCQENPGRSDWLPFLIKLWLCIPFSLCLSCVLYCYWVEKSWVRSENQAGPRFTEWLSFTKSSTCEFHLGSSSGGKLKGGNDCWTQLSGSPPKL